MIYIDLLIPSVLLGVFEKHSKDCDALFCVVGVLEEDQRQVVQLIRHDRLEGIHGIGGTCLEVCAHPECLQKFKSVTSIHVHW